MFGLKGDIENNHPIAFMTNFFKEVLEKQLIYEPAIEIAHKIGPVLRLRPRPMIIRMQRHRTDEAMLKLENGRGGYFF